MFKLSQILNEIKIQGSNLPIPGKLYSLNFWGKHYDKWSPPIWKFIGFVEPDARQKKLYPERKIILKFQNNISSNHYEDYYDIKKFKWWREELDEIKMLSRPNLEMVLELYNKIWNSEKWEMMDDILKNYFSYNVKKNEDIEDIKNLFPQQLKQLYNDLLDLIRRENINEIKLLPKVTPEMLYQKQTELWDSTNDINRHDDISKWKKYSEFRKKYLNQIKQNNWYAEGTGWYSLDSMKKYPQWLLNELYNKLLELSKKLDEIKLEPKIKDFPGKTYNESAKKLYFKLIPYFKNLKLTLNGNRELVRLVITLPNRKLNLGETINEFFIYENWDGNGFGPHKKMNSLDELANYTIKTYREK